VQCVSWGLLAGVICAELRTLLRDLLPENPLALIARGQGEQMP